jgi:adenosine deaminase
MEATPALHDTPVAHATPAAQRHAHSRPARAWLNALAAALRAATAALVVLLSGAGVLHAQQVPVPTRPDATRPAGATPSTEELAARYLDGIRHDPLRTLMFIREMPKGADLHSHLSGVIYAESYIEWAAADSLCINALTGGFVPPPCDPAAGRPPAAAALQSSALYNRVVDALSMRNWNPAERTGHDQFFGSFGLFVLATRHMAPMLAEATSRAAAGRVSYLELMATLDLDASGRLAAALGWDADLSRLRQRLLQAGFRDSATAALRRLDAVEAGQRESQACASNAPDPGCAVEVRYLYQVQRARAPELVFAQILMGFEMAAVDPRVVGLNLVQPEDHYIAVRDYSLHMRMIGMLREHYPGVQVSLHAGELVAGLVPPERMRYHIAEAVRVAGASRIGHGVSIAHEDGAQDLLREMAARGILVEIALGSNDAILGVHGRDHPLRLYMDYGVPVALATDDEGVLRSDINHEFLRGVQDQALRYPELKAMARNSLIHAFADDVTKARLLNALDRDLAEFERKYALRMQWTDR